MDNLLPWFDIAYRIAVILGPIAAAGVLWWLRANFISRPDFDKFIAKFSEAETATANHAHRLAALEEDNRETPTRIELMQQLGMVGERLSHIEARQEADRETFTRQLASVGRQLDTLNSYLHTLVETAIQRGAK